MITVPVMIVTISIVLVALAALTAPPPRHPQALPERHVPADPGAALAEAPAMSATPPQAPLTPTDTARIGLVQALRGAKDGARAAAGRDRQGEP
jgi:hypothetical protein